ncbi:MAG: bifunctional diaminohydroxyphosphoribosylaminopyrimidine deaminase/5-amino-6-(5-phosphoribosylamino)uracil reductase RibD [Chlorobiaceae bacterium]|nr:bifunctional diaminohydroxyphosphoribosylaminopyrimidine deaminase/5-amino-6-(5-phosphoribosylamino)uracil reductase RibD [Chlorobiaceae bacterium]NTV61324.1 bifunctional diaminohydroxyphosphoribosylaminopyrimidine deaminase/5-amino-6-(5-phosphoribosylamino)uracil reductase RibD [Chlorobiaceae bacterium]
MKRCLELAEKGAGSVSPNPMVGAVIVHEGAIIGEGCHERFGGPHAEVNAIASVSRKELLVGSTLYVNLEPCSHFGKTPPCSDLIIETGIPRVVTGCRDPHEAVAGKGIAKLLAAGVSVTEGVMERECMKLNEAFIKSHTRGLPFVAVKLAETLDGKIATSLGASRWITGEESRREVHRLRAVYDAVLTGEATVRLDDSLLTVRNCEGRNPLRVILDRRMNLPLDAGIFNAEAPTIVFASKERRGVGKVQQLKELGVEVAFVADHAGGLDLKAVLQELQRRNVLSLLVEGGSRLSASFVRENLADKLYLFIAPKLFGSDALSSFGPLGVSMPEESVKLCFEPPRFFGRDILLEAYVEQ